MADALTFTVKSPFTSASGKQIVVNLVAINDSQDFETVIGALAMWVYGMLANA